MPDYLGQYVAHLDLRPKRACYLVRPGSARSFTAAVARACSRWGGVQEPIVPVSASGQVRPAWRQVVEILKPDVAFMVDPMSDAARARVQALVGLAPVAVRREDLPQYGTHVLTGFPPPGAADSSVLMPRGRALADRAGPGALAPWDDPEVWRAAGIQVHESDDGAQLALAQLEGHTVIEATGAQVGEVMATNVSTTPPVLWVYERSNARDVLWFWNMRALMPRSFRYPPMALMSLEAAASEAFRDALSGWLAGRHRGTTPDLIVNSLSVSSERLRRLVRSLGLAVHTGRAQTHWGREGEGPLAAAVQLDLRSHVIGERVAGLRTSTLVGVQRPRTTIRMPAAVTFRRPGGGHVLARISGLPFVTAPQRPAVAKLIHENAEWHDGGLQLETSAYAIYQFDLRAPSPEEVLTASLAGGPQTVDFSPPGRLAAAVLDLADDRAIFADMLCLRVVSALTTPRSRSLVAELAQQLPASVTQSDLEALARRVGAGARQVDLALPAVASRVAASLPNVSQAVERLVRQRLVVRGLRTDCSRCGLKTFTPLPDARPHAPCAGCGASARYAGKGREGEPVLHYRLNALVDRASDQGVLCHLYGWARLQERGADQGHTLLGADLTWPGGATSEVDLLGYCDQVVFSGEAKMTAGWFTPDQLARDIALSARLGVDAHVMACLEPLPQRVRDLASMLAGERSLMLWSYSPA